MLKECEVQEGNVVADETEAKGEKFMVFEGLEDVDDGEDDDGMEEDREMVGRDMGGEGGITGLGEGGNEL